jgi:hypothetical protein
MNKENNILPSFSFSIKEYLSIFEINSLLSLNNFVNTRLNSNTAIQTIIKIFIYGMFEYKNTIINSPDITINIISKILSFVNKSSSVNQDKIYKTYKMILSAKDLDDLEKVQDYIEK